MATRTWETGTPLWKAWRTMRQRTTPRNKEVGRFPTYHDVKCDPRWATFDGFEANPPPGEFGPGMELARIGDKGDYSPENTRWLTKAENLREMWERRMVRLPDGRFACDVAREHGIKESTWRNRVERGADIETAVTSAGGVRGEDNPNAKLTAAQVAEIRVLLPLWAPRLIALRYGVSPTTIRDIAAGRRWAVSSRPKATQ